MKLKDSRIRSTSVRRAAVLLLTFSSLLAGAALASAQGKPAIEQFRFTGIDTALSADPSTARPFKFTVTSTLSGKQVLPHRIHWVAHPNLPASRIAEVDFLIDGKTRWIEHYAPYMYGDDGNWLVTSWLSPGNHRFTVLAKTNGGRAARRTTVASVVPAPPPPAELAGTWKRTVTEAEAHGAPAGTWVLSVDKAGWKMRDPVGTGVFIDVAYFSGGQLQARGGIWTKPHNPYEGNGWCENTNTPVDYSWAVSANTLTLTLAGPDNCGHANDAQHFIWAGSWTKVG